MEKKTLSNILEGKIFQIPDYQRGYAWEEKQWNDFVQDIDSLIDDKILSHYTGTIVIYQPTSKPTELYGTKKLEIVEVVDGQQRLTTCNIYLSIIINKLIELKYDDYKAELPIYLYSGSKSKLRLNNESDDFFYDIISKGTSNIDAMSIHQKRILDAYTFLKSHVENQLKVRKNDKISYLTDIFDAIIRKLNFSFYPIELESEIGMTFELMNSRGKDLSSMELLKNYLMYWIYRNIDDNIEKEDITKKVNKTWKEVYVNLSKSNGNENQCLRIAWTLYINYTPKNWEGYNGFKSDDVFPLRNFKKNSKKEIQLFITKFIDGLSLVSKHYSSIISPNKNEIIQSESILLNKIKNAGNIANYLPLMVAARIHRENNIIGEDEYFSLLKSLEVYSYRVFLWEGKRSNAGLSKFFKWADDLYTNKESLTKIINWIYATINWYSQENSFRKYLKENYIEWYHYKRLLKYTLFEYELYLLNGKNSPKIKWEELSDSTIEHILPQNPDKKSNWLTKFNKNERRDYIHDIGNLVLTKDNSRYSNFEFDIKRGISGSGFSYSNSDIRQEREIAKYDDWNPENFHKRRDIITNWIIDRWGIEKHYEINENLIEDDDESELD